MKLFTGRNQRKSELPKLQKYIDAYPDVTFHFLRGKEIDNGYVLEAFDKSFYLKFEEIASLLQEKKIGVKGLRLNDEKNSDNPLVPLHIREPHNGDSAGLYGDTSFFSQIKRTHKAASLKECGATENACQERED